MKANTVFSVKRSTLWTLGIVSTYCLAVLIRFLVKNAWEWRTLWIAFWQATLVLFIVGIIWVIVLCIKHKAFLKDPIGHSARSPLKTENIIFVVPSALVTMARIVMFMFIWRGMFLLFQRAMNMDSVWQAMVCSFVVTVGAIVALIVIGMAIFFRFTRDKGSY